MVSTDTPTPRPAEKEFSAWNEDMVERYDIERYYERSHFLVRWVEAKRLRALQALAMPAPGDRLLEVGCGAGHVLERFPGVDRTAIDLSPTMLARTRRRMGDGVHLTRSTAERLPFADASFDIVLCTEVLEHTYDPLSVICELLRVARPAGRVVVSIPSEANIDRAKRLLRHVPGLRRVLRTLADTGNEWHLHDFDLRMLRDMVYRAGAEITRLRGVPGPIAAVRYVAVLRPVADSGRPVT